MNYMIGKPEVLRLREDCRAKLGDKLSLTQFHDRSLAAGLVPVKLNRRELMGEDGPVLRLSALREQEERGYRARNGQFASAFGQGRLS